MDKSIVIAATVPLMSALAWIENARYRGVQRLPAHWGISGKVDGYAPRWFALSFIPALGAVTMTVIDVFMGRAPDGLVPVLGTAISFVAVQLLHFALIRKTRR